MNKACLLMLLAAPALAEPPPISSEPPQPLTVEERAKEDEGLVQQRVKREVATVENPFVITPHRPNYILPVKYNSSTNQPPVEVVGEEVRLQDVEMKFQLSLKFPIAFNLFGDNGQLWAAYTQQAFWQAYNDDISAPFRETNHEPELFLAFDISDDWFGIKPKYALFGFNHQSNGRSEPLSRSWNRLYADFIFETENLVLSVKPWYRIPESREEDDNPDIDKYLGHGEITGVYVMGDYQLDFMVRNNLRSDNRGAVQLGVSFPLWGKMKGYVQYFNGYGESLIEYNRHSQSIGVGIMLTNWL
ncbi:phospholipase A [Gallaecimonas sp. GXIMD4217]|uniref:phospholipase A n=1 Tax=Gallaecimonas sp. GXIMD4217 TaxID=3131927 RepID=UPI00311B137C